MYKDIQKEKDISPVKRYGFRGSERSHGQSSQLRARGSLGASSTPSRVFKGMRMAGQMGNKKLRLLIFR